jgi:hypothetical protein
VAGCLLGRHPASSSERVELTGRAQPIEFIGAPYGMRTRVTALRGL